MTQQTYDFLRDVGYFIIVVIIVLALYTNFWERLGDAIVARVGGRKEEVEEDED